MVESQVKTKLPEPERGMTIFYATDDNRSSATIRSSRCFRCAWSSIDQQPKQLKEVV